MTTAELIAAIAEIDPTDAPAILAAVSAKLAHPRPAPEPPVVEPDDVNLTLEEAAKQMRRSTKWIYRHRPTLPFVRKLGPRSYLCSQNALNKWLAHRPLA